jgi:WD40 repeat protein
MLLLQHPIARDVLALAFAPAGRTLFAGVNGGFAVWDLDTGESSLTPIRHSTRYWGFATDPLGRGLHVAADGYQFYPPPYREFRRLAGVLAHDDFRGDNHVTSLALSWDGGRLAVSRGILAVNRLECWDIAADGRMNLASIALSRDGMLGAAGGQKGQLVVWDVEADG